jgi:hypothetical protein
MTPLRIERWWPYGITVVGVAVWFWILGAAFPENSTDLMLATGPTAAVLVGFVATVMAIVLTITGSPVFRTLRKAGYHNDLFRYLFEAALWGTTFLCLSLVGFFVATEKVTPLWFEVCWVTVAMATLWTFVRVFQIVFKLLRQA